MLASAEPIVIHDPVTMKHNRPGVVTEGITYLKYVTRMPVRRSPRIKFFVFGSGRSGSTLLVDLLDSHPRIQCEGELLSRRMLLPDHFIRCRAALSRQEAYGFKLLCYHLTMVHKKLGLRTFVTHLVNSGYKVVYLNRRNAFRRALSNLYARHRDQFHSRQGGHTAPIAPMRVDLDELLGWMEGIENTVELERDVLRGLPHVQLIYEDDLKQPACQQPAIDRITEYLGLPSMPVTTELKKATPRELSRFVANYEEVVAFVDATAYADYLP